MSKLVTEKATGHICFFYDDIPDVKARIEAEFISDKDIRIVEDALKRHIEYYKLQPVV